MRGKGTDGLGRVELKRNLQRDVQPEGFLVYSFLVLVVCSLAEHDLLSHNGACGSVDRYPPSDQGDLTKKFLFACVGFSFSLT